MKLRHIIPLASLAVVCAVVAIGALHDEPLGMEFTVPPQDADIPDVDLGLGTQVLRGLLVDQEGQPVPDAGITTEQAGRPIWAWSSGDGTFTLKELRPGPLLLRVVALNFEATHFNVTMEGAAASGPPVNLVLENRIGAPPTPPPLTLGDLTGSVNFGPLAEPELGYEVLLQPTTAPTDPSGGFPRRVRVATDGSFRVDLLHAGEYRVVLLSPRDRGGNGPDLLQRADGTPRTMTHETSGDTPRLELVATMGGVMGTIVTGRDVDEASADALNEPAAPSPIRGALVKLERIGESPASLESWRMSATIPHSISDSSPDAPAPGPTESEAGGQGDETVNKVTFRAVRSDENGDFRLRDLPPGRYRLTLVAGRERHEQDVTVPEREVTTVNVDLSDR